MKQLCSGTLCFLLLCVALSAVPAHAGQISYTCSSNMTDGSIVSMTEGLQICAYLNSTIAGVYGSVFANANSKIFIEFGTGLGSNEQNINTVTYSQYFTQLSSESTDFQALNSLSVGATGTGNEPTIFGNGRVGLTASLASTLGFTGVGGLTAPTTAGTYSGVTGCAITATGCYDGVVMIGSIGSLWFGPTISGGTHPPNNDYDFATVVEHETDEVLGTLSCISTSGSLAEQCGTGGPPTNNPDPSAVDLFRYSGPNTRSFETTGAAYFSADGGVTDYDNNHYNTLANGEDFADFSSGCTFVQDAVGCTNGTGLDISTDGPGGKPGPEVAMLNAVGYNLGPEPASMFLFATGLAGIIATVRRKRA